MNEELKTKLLHYLETIEKGVEHGADFVAEQTPLYVQEFLAWEFWEGVVLAVCFAIPAAFVFWFTWKVTRAIIRNNSEEILPLMIFPLAAAVGLLIGSICCSMHAIKTHVAPRVVIVESLQKALK